MISFIRELVSRAFGSAIASMSTSVLALAFPFGFAIYKSALSYRKNGWSGVKQHFFSDVFHSLVFGVCWWVVLFSYFFLVVIPRSIRAEANRQPPPSAVTKLIPKESPLAYLNYPHSVVKANSFVFACCTLVVNSDMWDFILKHRGPDDVESIDVMFQDMNELQAIRQNTPPNTTVDLTAWSKLFHVDKMYPNGRGSLFAKQFLWKPETLDHGHYTLDISASTGRFHEDLFIEKTTQTNKFTYAALVTDIDTKQILLVCRDREFPKSLAPNIRAKKNCFPDWITEP